MSQLLENVVLVFPKVSYWSGKAGTKNDEVDRSSIPEIVSLGSKKIFDQKAINSLAKFRKRLERLGLKYGTKFEDGFMLPCEDEADFFAEYAPIEQAYLAAKSAFISDYAENAENFIAQHPNEEVMIRSSLPDVATVENSIRISARSYRVELNQGVIDTEEVKTGIYYEISQACRSIHNDYFESAKTIRGKALKKRFLPINNKLQSFAFVDSKISKILQSLQEYFSSLDDDDLNQQQESMGKLLFNLLSHSNTIEDICNSTWLPKFSVSTDENEEHTPHITHSVTEDAYF